MLRDFFRGRYGIDLFTIVLLFISLMLFGSRTGYVWIGGLAVLGYAGFRTISKNIEKRRREQAALAKLFSGIFRPLANRYTGYGSGFGNRYYNPQGGPQPAGGLFSSLGKSLLKYKTRFTQRKLYVFMPCPKCRKTLRLPRNKGNLQVKCPVCGSEFYKKT